MSIPPSLDAHRIAENREEEKIHQGKPCPHARNHLEYSGVSQCFPSLASHILKVKKTRKSYRQKVKETPGLR